MLYNWHQFHRFFVNPLLHLGVNQGISKFRKNYPCLSQKPRSGRVKCWRLFLKNIQAVFQSVPYLWVPGYFSILPRAVFHACECLDIFPSYTCLSTCLDVLYRDLRTLLLTANSQLYHLGLVQLLAMYQTNEMLCLLKFVGHLYPTSAATDARGGWYHILNHSVDPHGVLKTAGPSLTILFPWKFSSETFSLRKKEESKSCTVRKFQKY